VRITRAIFELLSTRHEEQVGLESVAAACGPDMPLEDVDVVARALAVQHVLRFVTRSEVVLHRPHYLQAFRLLRERPIFSRIIPAVNSRSLLAANGGSADLHV